MRLLVMGDIPVGSMPDVPDEVTSGVFYVGTTTVMPENLPFSCTVVTEDASSLPEGLLEQVTDLVEDPDPLAFIALTATSEDLVFMPWDDSAEMYGHLKWFNSRDITVFDMLDGYQVLEIGGVPDISSMVSEITRRVTRDVLKTIRAEMAKDSPK